MSKSTFRILFYLRKNYLNKSGKAGIMIRLTVNGDMVQFSSKLDIEPPLWDTKAGKAAGNSVKARQMNSMLDDIRTALNNHYRYVESRDSFVTAEKVRNAFLGYETRQQTLLELFRQHNEDASKLNGISKAPATLVKYDRTYRRLAEFMKAKYKVSDMPLRSLDLDFIEAFDRFMHIEKRHKASTKLGHLKCLKAIMNDGLRRGYLPYNPFKGYMADKPEDIRRHLSMDELKRIMSVRLDSPNRKFTRDLFVFSSFTGICYCDLCNLTEKNIYKAEDGRFWIRTKRQKTGTVENVPLLDIPLSIIRKYRGMAADGKLFPMLTHGSVTAHLKKIAAQCGIQRNVTFHQARHSFASVICLSLGVPIETVSRIMGHKNITTTQHYAKVTYEKIDKDVSALGAGIEGKFSLNGIDLPPSTVLKDMTRRVCRKTWKMSPAKIQERKERKEKEMKMRMKGEAV